MAALDPIELAQALIRCPSVTPKDEGALAILEKALTLLGFICHRLHFEQDGTAPIDNLYARIGTAGPNFCFAGHTDVVPPGENWQHNPFAATVEDGVLYGRGAVDMKSAIAAFAAAASRYLQNGTPKGSISLLITGDEEGPAINGTPKMLGWLKERGETLSHCIVGEPTATARAGDTLKIGRRGSITAEVTVRGVQGHVGYPHRARNPIPAMAALVMRLSSHILDKGTEHFEPSTLSFTTVDVGNPAANVIPAEARAVFNIRFNDSHSANSLKRWIEGEAKTIEADTKCEITLRFTVGGDVFITKPGSFTDLVSKAVQRATNAAPEFSTTGGTSDARFIRSHCPVAELGLPGSMMHKVDECVPVTEIARLSDIYLAILEHYFADPLKMSDDAIGIFNSGMGGLTVLRALMARLPNERFIYLGDTARLPYGTKSPDTVTRYAVQAAGALVRRRIKLLVIACNTASGVALGALQEAFAPLPVIDVIGPGARAALAASPSGPIAVIATEATVKAQAYVRAIHAQAPDVAVTQQACPLFVSLAEEGLVEGEIAELVAQRYLAPVLAQKPHAMVLGCTHYPALKATIGKIAGRGVKLVDSAETTAEEVERQLKALNLLRRSGDAPVHHFLATDAPERFERVGQIFLGQKIDPAAIELVDLQ